MNDPIEKIPVITDCRFVAIAHTPSAEHVPNLLWKSGIIISPEMTDCSHPKRNPARDWKRQRVRVVFRPMSRVLGEGGKRKDGWCEG